MHIKKTVSLPETVLALQLSGFRNLNRLCSRTVAYANSQSMLHERPKGELYLHRAAKDGG